MQGFEAKSSEEMNIRAAFVAHFLCIRINECLIKEYETLCEDLMVARDGFSIINVESSISKLDLKGI